MPELLRRFMINRSRAFIYATAPSPLMAAGVRAALKICATADDRRATLQSRIAQLEAERENLLARVAALRFTMSRAFDWLNTPADALVVRKSPMAFARRLEFYADPANAGIFAAA